VIAGVAGVAAGTLITAGAVGLAAVSLGLIAAAPLAPVLIAVGIGLAIGVGIYHLAKWWSSSQWRLPSAHGAPSWSKGMRPLPLGTLPPSGSTHRWFPAVVTGASD
jgi:hypothetical protein